MSRPTQVTIDLSALQHNLRQVKQMAPQSAVIAMVKSNAYGHGLERVALALHEADAFGVACVEEGMQLRHAGIEKDIFLMEGIFYENELPQVVANHFTLIVHHLGQIDMLEKHPPTHPISVWLKVDTGMHRLGVSADEAAACYARLMACPGVKKPIGIMTHFADADSNDRARTLQQIETFDALSQGLPGPRSLSNSAGVIAWPTAHGDLVRPGIMLYGASPLVGHRGVEHHLLPVMTLSSELIEVKKVKKGERVGYGGIWVCPEDMSVGIVAVGYGDGYPRHVREGVPVLVNRRPCPLIGRVSMDMITVDLRSQPDAKIGDPVLLWGAGLPVEVVAEYSETNAYELLTRITQRVRVVVKSEELVN